MFMFIFSHLKTLKIIVINTNTGYLTFIWSFSRLFRIRKRRVYLTHIEFLTLLQYSRALSTSSNAIETIVSILVKQLFLRTETVVSTRRYNCFSAEEQLTLT